MNSSSFSSNRIQQILLNKQSDKRIGSLSYSSSDDAAAFQKIAREISMNPSILEEMQFTTGIGLSQRDGIPVRLPAILLPVLNVMEQLAHLNLPLPRYVVYQATDFIAQTNNIPLVHAKRVSADMDRYLSRYIHSIHPKVAHAVDIRFGCEYTNEVRSSIERVREDIRIHTSDVLERLECSERRHSGDCGQALTYAAANIVYSGASPYAYPFQNSKDDRRMAVFPVGGRAEQPFFSLISQAARHYGMSDIIPLFTQLGSRPTYYSYPEKHDPLTVQEYRDALNTKIADGPLRVDLQALIADGVTPDVLSTIYSSSIL